MIHLVRGLHEGIWLRHDFSSLFLFASFGFFSLSTGICPESIWIINAQWAKTWNGNLMLQDTTKMNLTKSKHEICLVPKWKNFIVHFDDWHNWNTAFLPHNFQTPESLTLFLMFLTPMPLNCRDDYSCSPSIQRGQMYSWSCSLTKGIWSKGPVIKLHLAGTVCQAEQLNASWFLGWYSQ